MDGARVELTHEADRDFQKTTRSTIGNKGSLTSILTPSTRTIPVDTYYMVPG